MTPPVFAVLAVVFGTAVGREFRTFIDSHTAAFLQPRWRHFQWLQNALCRRAATTIVTNDYLAQRIASIGGHSTIVTDVPVVYERVETFSTAASCSVAVICSFNYDEPIAEIVEGATRLPDVSFYITGNRSLLPSELVGPYLRMWCLPDSCRMPRMAACCRASTQSCR